MQWLASICVRRPVFATVLILFIARRRHRRLQAARTSIVSPTSILPVVHVITTLSRRRAGGDCHRALRQDRRGGQHHQRHRRAALRLHRGGLAGHRQLPARQGRQRRGARGARARVDDPDRPAPGHRRRPVVSKLDPDAAPVLFLALRVDPSHPGGDRVRRPRRSARRWRTSSGVGQVVDRRRAQAPDPGCASIPNKLRAARLTAVDVQRAIVSPERHRARSAPSTPDRRCSPSGCSGRVPSAEAVSDDRGPASRQPPDHGPRRGARDRRCRGGSHRRQHRRQRGGASSPSASSRARTAWRWSMPCARA